MGTDIHTVFQKRISTGWEDIPSEFNDNRHYYLFAWLADVRNGTGFAGVKTGDEITPLSEPRGLPSDFEIIDEEYHPTTKDKINNWRRGYWSDEEPQIWMGDHSYSWFTFDEILNAPPLYDVVKTGYITKEEFEKWDKKSQPTKWCGDISGRDIVKAEQPNSITPTTTHVRVTWFMPDGEFDYFIEELRRLCAEHKEKPDNMRVVFGFDS